MSNYAPTGNLPGRSGVPVWLWLLPVLSCCMLGFVPPIVVAAKARTRESAMWATGFTVAFLAGFALVGSGPTEGDSILSNIGALLVVVTGVGGACYAVIAGAKLDWGRASAVPYAPVPYAQVPTMPAPHDPNHSAVASVMAARQKQAAARELAQRDPLMARDLRIGRPDLPRHFDDGGLIDVNTAPADVMARGLGLTPEQAQQIVAVREGGVRFERLDDLLNIAFLDVAVFDHIKDRVIIM